MKFIFTGTGTSQGVPVIGCDCDVCTSTDPRDRRLRTSGILQVDGLNIVFDTGPDFRQQMLTHHIHVLDGIVYTHQHKDHTAGLDDIRAYNFRLKRKMKIFANDLTINHLRKEYYYIFENSDYPALPQLDIHHIDGHTPFEIGNTTFTPIPVLHGKLPVLGFRVGNFAYITDASYIPPSSMNMLRELDVLILNALRKQDHRSHFTLPGAIEIVNTLQPRHAYFTHISHVMGKHQQVEEEDIPEGMHLAYDGLVLEILE